MMSDENTIVWAQETPNPYAIKFIVNSKLKEEGKATFLDVSECEELPLVKAVFQVMGVKQVYISENTMTVTHDGSLMNEDLKSEVEAGIISNFSEHDVNFKMASDENKPKKIDRTHLTEEQKEIEEILDRTIRPGLRADGGDIDVIDFKDNELKILFQGACGGCPSALYGTLDAIQGILSSELNNPELKVVPI